MSVLSIQSHVAYGYVGNRAATFPLQRMGHEVLAVNTVQFSNHTGYGTWKGDVHGAAHVSSIIEGISERHGLNRCNAAITGYMGDRETGEVILKSIKELKNQYSKFTYLCDPVMGGLAKGCVVSQDIPEFIINELIPLAAVITPNHFEAERIVGYPIQNMRDAMRAVQDMHARGPKTVVITSLRRQDGHGQAIETLLSCDQGVWVISTPYVDFPIAPSGTGDLFSALFLGHTLNRLDPVGAFGRAVGGVYAILQQTRLKNRRELDLVDAQECFLNPPKVFPALPCELLAKAV